MESAGYQIRPEPFNLAELALVERALENLIENALGHTPEKGKVTVKIFAGADIEISVSDSGPGIPEREPGFMFACPQQADLPDNRIIID